MATFYKVRFVDVKNQTITMARGTTYPLAFERVKVEKPSDGLFLRFVLLKFLDGVYQSHSKRLWKYNYAVELFKKEYPNYGDMRYIDVEEKLYSIFKSIGDTNGTYVIYNKARQTYVKSVYNNIALVQSQTEPLQFARIFKTKEEAEYYKWKYFDGNDYEIMIKISKKVAKPIE